MTSAEVRALVVTWNGAHLLPACLDSLERQTVRDLMEIVVVDNGSTDGTAALLAQRYPDVRVLLADRNLGFAGGAELGMREASGHVLLLNNDATLAFDGVERLLEAFSGPGTQDVGAATARVLLAEPDGSEPRRVNSTGNLVDAYGQGRDRDWLAPVGTESHDPDVFGLYGGASLLRREALARIGGFDPWLFLYYEDTDLSWRLRAAGWRVVYVESAVAVHQHSATADTASPLFRYYNTRNSLVVAARHAPWPVVVRATVRQCLGLVRALATDGPGPVTRARAKGFFAALVRLPTTVRERRR